MTRLKLYAAGLISLTALVAAVAPLANAEPGRNTDKNEIAETQNDDSTSSDTGARRQLVDQKREEIKARLEALKTERTAKLDEKRLATCEKKADKINALIQKRSTQATKHLSVFDKISERVQQFVTDKELTIENYEALVDNIEDKRAAAEAAIEANTDTTFECESVDSSDPGKVARTSVAGVRDALKNYRTAIKDLIVQVKSNNALKTDDASGTTESETDTSTGSENETDTNTDTSTGEGQ